MQNPFLPNNIADGTLLPQAIPGGTGTRPKASGADEKLIHFLKVCCSRFRLQLIAIYCNRRGGVDSTPHTSFSSVQKARAE